MHKPLFRRAVLALFIIGASVSVAALTGNRSDPAPLPAVCSESGRWLSFDGKRLQATASAGVIAEALASEVVLLGEYHDAEDHHRWQLQMLAALHAQRPDLVIGFEMFPRRAQPVLDRWVAGQLTTQEFLAQSEWEKVWKYPPQLYLPLFEFARINRIPVVALNIDQALTRAISEKGWDGVPVAEREGIGRPAAPPAAYRESLRKTHRAHAGVRGHGGPAAKPEVAFENFLDAQLVWDRAMAEALVKPPGPRAAVGDGQRSPLRVGIMGIGHIQYGHGVPHQLRDLGIQRVATLLPVAGKEACGDLQPGLANAVFLLPDQPEPKPEPPRLGVSLEMDDKRVRIAQVTPGSLAEKSGLLAGDRFVEVAGRAPASITEAIAAVRRQPSGTWLPLKVDRNGAQIDIVVRFPARP